MQNTDNTKTTVAHRRRMCRNGKEVRNSGIELLRIISMLMIIAHHFAVHTVWANSGTKPTWFGGYCIEIFASFGKIGAAIFFMITGYFLATRSKYSARKVWHILLPTWFYSIAFFTLAVLLGVGMPAAKVSWPLNAGETQSIFPLLSGRYWFIAQYVIVFLLSPFLKKGLDALSERALVKMGTIMFVVTSILRLAKIILNTGDYSIFVIPEGLYFVIFGYIIYRLRDKFVIKKVALVTLATVVVLCVAPFILDFLRGSLSINAPGDLFWSARSICTLILSGGLLILFSRLQFESKIINYIAGLVLGVYLIHDNIWVRTLLWNGSGFFNNAAYLQFGGLRLALHGVCIILVVFILCATIEAIRQTIARLFSKILKRTA